MSAESSKTPTLSADTVFAIPHIEINVNEEEHLRMDEFLKNASLPPPDQVRFPSLHCFVLELDCILSLFG